MGVSSLMRSNVLRWILALIFLTAAIVGNVYFSDVSPLYRAMGAVVCFSIAAWSLAGTTLGALFLNVIRGARTEAKRIVWPSRDETVRITLVVIVVVILMSLILWCLDTGLGFLISSLIG